MHYWKDDTWVRYFVLAVCRRVHLSVCWWPDGSAPDELHESLSRTAGGTPRSPTTGGHDRRAFFDDPGNPAYRDLIEIAPSPPMPKVSDAHGALAHTREKIFSVLWRKGAGGADIVKVVDNNWEKNQKKKNGTGPRPLERVRRELSNDTRTKF